MNYTTTDSLADLRLTLDWEKDGIQHKDIYFADEANLYRDYFPPIISDRLFNKTQGERIDVTVKPGDQVPVYSKKNIHQVRPWNVDQRRIPDGSDVLRQGRYYPKGLISGIPGIFRENVTPFRVIDHDNNYMIADFNHPLADTDLKVSLDIMDIKDKTKERGGLCTDWLETVTSGPGIQSRYKGRASDFFSDSPFDREDRNPDSIFYSKNRLVSHIDVLAQENLADLYGRYLKKNSLVLDLMSSWQSHLPEHLTLKGVHGLGLNASELEKNPRLTERKIHDLNADPVLPYPDNTYDAVICSLSVEYMTRPFDVFREMARVLKPGGQSIITFSNRWFPTKTIRIWPCLHEFERLGLVTEYALESGRFETIETGSLRGFPRPYTDDYFPKLKLSDPIYMVRGIKKT